MRVTGLGDDQAVAETDGPINIEIDHGDEMLEVTITEDRVYFDRYGEDTDGTEIDDHQFSYYTHKDLLNKLKEEYGKV